MPSATETQPGSDDEQGSEPGAAPAPGGKVGAATLTGATAIGLIGAVAGIVLGIARTKVLALQLEPAGLGVYGQVLSLLTTLSAVSGLGLGLGTTKLVAESRATGARERLSLALAVSMTVPAMIALLLGIVLAASAPASSPFFLGTDRLTVMLVAACGVPFVALQGPIVHALQGFRDAIGVQAAAVVYGIVLTVTTLIGALSFGLTGAVVALSLSSIVNTVVLWLRLRHFTTSLGVVVPLRAGFRRSSLRDPAMRGMLSIGFVSLAISLLGGGWEVGVRTLVLRTSGEDEAGIWQALYLLSNQATGVIVAAVVFFGFTAVTEAGATGDRQTARRSIDDALRLTLLLALPTILAIGLFAADVVHVFLASSFDQAVALVPQQLIGDYFRSIGWVVGAMLVPIGLTRAWLLVSIAATAASFAVAAAVVPRLGVEGAVDAYVVINGLSALATTYVLRRAGYIAFSARTQIAIGLGALFLVAVYLAPSHRWTAAVVVVAGTVVLWLGATDRAERRSFVSRLVVGLGLIARTLVRRPASP